MYLLDLLYAYLIGGVTFIPLLIAAFIYLHPKKQPKEEEEGLKAGELEEQNLSGLQAYKQGWIYVTNEFLESSDNIASSTQSVADAPDGKSAYSSLYKLVKNSGTKITNGNGETTSASESDASITPAPGQGAAPKGASKKHRYYAVLKHGNLFLYKNEKLQDVKHVVVLSNYLVSLWPRDLTESQLFTKYSSIALLRKDWKRKRRLSDNVAAGEDSNWEDLEHITLQDVLKRDSSLPAPPGSFFIHTDYNIQKEDWYFTLINASKGESDAPAALDPNIQAKTLHFETQHMVNMISTLYSAEGQLHTKWLNAILNRLFLSLQHTDVMHNYLISRIEKKLNKIKTPGFLDKFQITKVRAGTGAPFITFPVLKEINPEGDLLVSLYVHYFGGMSVQLATKVNINLGSRFKPREVDVLLSMTLEKLQGPMLLRIKPPPSARMWYTFESEPAMNVKIEPVISSRQMSYNIITNSIEKKLKEAIKSSVVLPHWDDFVFYHTEDEIMRGGIWDKQFRAERTGSAEAPEQDEKEISQSKPGSASPVRGDAESTVSASAASTYSKAQESNYSAEEQAELADESIGQPGSTKARLSSTISDFSKRLRKAKSAHTLGVDETNCLSDGSLVERSPSETTSVRGLSVEEPGSRTPLEQKTSSTLRKIGKWYYRDEKGNDTRNSTYHPPEMISNRRSIRKQSSASQGSEAEKSSIEVQSSSSTSGFSYDFGSEQPDPVLGHPPVSSLAKSTPSTQSVSAIEVNYDGRESNNAMHDAQVQAAMSVPSSSLPSTVSRSKSTLHRKPPPQESISDPNDAPSLLD